MTDGDAGERLGVSGPTFQRWRTGGHIPKLSKSETLAEFLGLAEAEVVTAIHESQLEHDAKTLSQRQRQRQTKPRKPDPRGQPTVDRLLDAVSELTDDEREQLIAIAETFKRKRS